jgi:hypothetical protein
MKKQTLVILLLLIGSFIHMNLLAQQTQQKFIQFVFTNLDSREKAKEIDEFMRGQVGVTMSRADNSSKKYLVLFDSSAEITLEKIEIWMLQLGMTFKCYREGTHGIDTIIHQTTDCE